MASNVAALSSVRDPVDLLTSVTSAETKKGVPICKMEKKEKSNTERKGREEGKTIETRFGKEVLKVNTTTGVDRDCMAISIAP